MKGHRNIYVFVRVSIFTDNYWEYAIFRCVGLKTIVLQKSLVISKRDHSYVLWLLFMRRVH